MLMSIRAGMCVKKKNVSSDYKLTLIKSSLCYCVGNRVTSLNQSIFAKANSDYTRKR